MNDQSSNNEPLNHHRERPAISPHAGAWVAGIILIGLGAAFLAQNIGFKVIPLDNWWALFILIPAVGAFGAALRTYRSAGNQWTAPARSSLLGGIVLTFLVFGFLFRIGWKYFGPILIILAGLGILSNRMIGKEE
jgi:hypothetical protein